MKIFAASLIAATALAANQVTVTPYAEKDGVIIENDIFRLTYLYEVELTYGTYFNAYQGGWYNS